MAAIGYSNRDIAQQLFITVNTVEVHLTRTYRKLGITGRANLSQALLTPPAWSRTR
jgi:DNA-binding CsgD family transcriptional regulator